jgi:hypothetical protein
VADELTQPKTSSARFGGNALLRWIPLAMSAAIALGVVLFAIGALRNSYGYSEISIQLLPDAKDPRDHQALGLLGGKELPDYTLEALVEDRWLRLGGYENRSAEDALVYSVNNPIPKHQIQSLRVRDQDFIESDILDEVPVNGQVMDGTLFRFTLVQEFDLQSGFHWFFATAIGRIIAWGVGAAICVVVLLLLAPLIGAVSG